MNPASLPPAIHADHAAPMPSHHREMARRIVTDAITRIRNGNDWGAQDAFRAGFREHRPRVIRYLKELGFYPLDFETVTAEGPEQLFVFAIDRCISGSPVSFPDRSGEPRPTTEDSASISLIEAAEWAGRSLGSEGIRGTPPENYSPDERFAWTQGQRAGFREFEAEEFDRWIAERDRQADAFERPEDRAHHSELAKAARLLRVDR